MKPVNLTTVDAVFEALGGIEGVMKLTGGSYQRVHNWKAAGAFPSNTYALCTDALAAKRLTADRALWKQMEGV